MPNLDNHMDELFQKAAENYPLKTNAGNFDDLIPFIGGETAKLSAKSVVATRKRKTSLMLLAFLITGFTIATTYLFTKINSGKIINNKASVKDKLIFPVQNNTIPDVVLNIVAPSAAETLTENALSSLTTIYERKKLVSYSKGKMFTNITSPVADTDEDSEKTIDQPGIVKTKENNSADLITNQQLVNNDIIKTEAKKEIIDQPGKKNKHEKEVPKPGDKKNKNKPILYYGIAAGVELNKVKSQDLTKAGFNGGLILGLQINKKIAVESGVQLSQKKYYSDGKYFKPKSGSMPANMKIMSLESSSTIIEIPVSVKYNFSKKKNTLYAKAGVSSYIMTKESNKYQAVVSGQQQEINSTYKTDHGYLASDVRISAGYQHTISKKINMRIEPYIQIPLKGIGIGALQVTTTGVQIILSRN